MEFSEDVKEHVTAIIDTIDTQSIKIKEIIQLIISTIDSGNKILIAGNGGSASDAQHVAAEFVNRFENHNRQPLPMISLSTDTSNITAIGNDYSFNQIFSKQINAIGFPGDLFIGISTSGKSQNIIEAFLMCKPRKLNTVLFTGSELPYTIDELVDITFAAQSRRTAVIQEVHIFTWHIICKAIDSNYKQIDVEI